MILALLLTFAALVISLAANVLLLMPSRPHVRIPIAHRRSTT